MGTSGIAAFENDHAKDWYSAILAASDIDSIEEAIERVLESKPDDMIDLDDAIESIAAAEIVAAANGRQCASLPSTITKWLAESNYQPGGGLAERAAQAVERIALGGELRNRWEAKAAWLKEMSGLAERLRAAPVRKRLRATEKSAASKGPLSRAAIQKKLGFRIAWGELNSDFDPTWAAAGVTLKDADLLLLGQIPSLKTLILAEGKFTVEGLQHITKLQLDRLNLEATNIDDGAGPVVAQMRGLKRLEIQDTSIGDRFLADLSKLAALEFLNVSQTNVTARGVKELKNALPRCAVQTEREE